MSEDKQNYSDIDKSEGLVYQTFDSLEGRLDKSKEEIDTFFDGIDPRVLRYKGDLFGKLVDKMDDLVDDKQDMKKGQDYYNRAYQGYRATKRAVEDINAGLKMEDVTSSSTNAALDALNNVNNNNNQNNSDNKNDELNSLKDDGTNNKNNDLNNGNDNKSDNDGLKSLDDEDIKIGAQVTNNTVPSVKGVETTLKSITSGEFDDKDSIGTSVVNGLGELGNGIVDVIESGATRLRQQISPYAGNVGVTKGMNKSTAGIIAAASIAAGGAGVGGGLLVKKKMSFTHFTPADWLALGEDYQSVIEKLMREVGFSTDEVETFKNSYFKIATADLKEHIKKITKALSSNPNLDDEFLKLYNYSMIDSEHKVIEYLLFITMIIDGRNTIDNYNMYSVINQALEDAEDADFFYTGIDMEDYFDEDNDEVEIANDPTTVEEKETENKEETSEQAEEPEQIEDTTKEWLKGIGMEDL